MSHMATTDMCLMDSAVSLRSVSKTFTQWQRESMVQSLSRYLLKPETRVVHALDDLTFDIAPGEFVAYAGPNGAGKSTTMKLLAGMLLPTQGEISVLGLSPRRQRSTLMRRLGILFGNRTELWWDHPIIQSFAWKKVVWDIADREYAANLEMVTALLDIGDLLKTFARELSLGQRMRADLAMMLLHSPEIILLDEPTLGLDVVAKRQMIDFLKRINREKAVTIIVTSHDMDDLEEMARRILMISKGKIAYDGDFDGLRKIAGSLSRIRVAMEDGAVPPLAVGQLLTAQNGVYEYEVDLEQIPVKQLLQALSGVGRISEIEISKAPIEEVIAKLYQHWKN